MFRLNVLFRAPLAVIVVLMLLGVGRGLVAQSSVEGPLADPATKTLTNDSIVRMVKAGLGDDLILQTIAAQPGSYATDADAMVALKGAGVSDRIIAGMVNKSRKQITPGHEKAVVVPEVNE